MGISLEKAELISLALTTFLYGESRNRLDCPPVFPLTYEPADRVVLRSVSHHDCGDVLQGNGGYSSTAHKDSSCVMDDVSGGDYGGTSFHMPALCIDAVLFQHLIIIWIRAMQGFVVQKGGSAQAFYEDISDPTSSIKLSCMLLQTIMGDLVMVRGCFASALATLLILEDMAALCGLWQKSNRRSSRYPPCSWLFRYETEIRVMLICV